MKKYEVGHYREGSDAALGKNASLVPQPISG
jgi:hypothetical protein